MKRQLILVVAIVASTAIALFSCKKQSASIDNSAQVLVQSDDQSRFSTETDDVSNDANAALENMGGSYNGDMPMTPTLPINCDASVSVDTVSVPRRITITYNGASCNPNRTRTGTVVVSFAPGFRWGQAGAQYSVLYQNLRITRTSDNKSIVINGEKTVKNISGGRLRNLATAGTSIVHEVRGSNMSITFDDGSQRTWKFARRRTFTYANGIVLSITGIAPQGAGISEWGTNRYGSAFTSTITEPLVIRQSCNFRLVSGQVRNETSLATTTITMGLDASGNPVSSCPSGTFYYKVVWTGPAGVSYTRIAPYW
jgi:hypothetical protein